MSEQGSMFDGPDDGDGAVVSGDGLYRYLLWRRLAAGEQRTCLFIMLNPSTADASIDDPTIRRCKGFGARQACTRLEVVNLFAWRATVPDELSNVDLPVGEENGLYVRAAIERSDVIVAAWGAWWENQNINHRPARMNVEQFVADAGKDLLCLGLTKKGQPRHPLYAPKTSPLVPYEAAHVTKRGRIG